MIRSIAWSRWTFGSSRSLERIAPYGNFSEVSISVGWVLDRFWHEGILLGFFSVLPLESWCSLVRSCCSHPYLSQWAFHVGLSDLVSRSPLLKDLLFERTMSEDDGGDPSTSASPSSISGTEALEGEKSRSCRGCLLYSSSLRDSRRNPICIGLGRAEHRVYSLGGESERDTAKEGRRLTDFKYACIGYSIHKEATPTSERPIDGGELPLCVGVEFLADRRPQPASSPSPLEQLEQDDEGPPVMPRPPSAVRQPTTIGGMSGDEFASRFMRCAGLVASAVVRNVSHVATSIKTGVDDMVHDRRRPK